MAMKIDTNMAAVAHHVETGPFEFPYAIDAHSAVARFPDEWSFAPWSEADASAARAARHERLTAQAAQDGLPAPAPPVPPPEPTPEEKAAIDEDTKARADAAAIVKAAEEAERKRVEEAEKVGAAKALLASPPPRPDPNARRPLAGAAKANYERKVAKDEAERLRGAALNKPNLPAVDATG